MKQLQTNIGRKLNQKTRQIKTCIYKRGPTELPNSHLLVTKIH